MIHAFKELGKYALSKKVNEDELAILAEDAWDGGKNPHLLTIVFSRSEGIFQYKNVEYHEISAAWELRLLYRKKAPNGADYSPVSKFIDIEKTLGKKLTAWYNDNASMNTMLQETKTSLNGNLERIGTDIIEKIKQLNLKKGIVLATGWELDGTLKWFGDFSNFRTWFLEQGKIGFDENTKTGKCALCFEDKPVIGNFSDLKFYSIDKPGMVTGGFNDKNAYKNYPICATCKTEVKQGFLYTKENLTFKFHGLRYLLIPRISDTNCRNDVLDGLSGFQRNPAFNNKTGTHLLGTEDELLAYICENNFQMTFDLLFYREEHSGSVFSILSHIENITPYRVRALFEAKQFVEQSFYFDKQGGEFTFKIIRNFYPSNKFEGNHDQTFLKTITAIFHGEKIDYQQTISIIMKKLREQQSTNLCRSSFHYLRFLHKLNILKMNNNHYKEELMLDKEFKITNKEDLRTATEQFFSANATFFVSDAHKGLFLLGILTQFLLDIQLQERKATPFYAQLKSLKMSANDAACLLPRIIDKLEAYDKNYYKPLEELIADYLVSAGQPNIWKMSLDEVNYVFALGMSLSRYFKIEKEDKGDENEQNN